MNKNLAVSSSATFEADAEKALQELLGELDSKSSELSISLEDYANVLFGLSESLQTRAEGVQEEADEAADEED